MPSYSLGSKKRAERMPLTGDELVILESLSGKEKKQYIKELKKKYYGGSREG